MPDGLRGEWWIDDSGGATFADGNVGDQNHETIAFWSALGVDPNEEAFSSKYATDRALESITEYLRETDTSFSPDEILDSFLEEQVTPGYMTEKHAIGLLALGADAKAVEFFRNHSGDARTFMMVEHAWIRVANSNFQLWNLDDEALGRIRDFINNEYPEDEDPLEDEFQIEELREDGVHLSVSGSDLLESGKSADALKYSAQRERTGMYNPPDLDARHAELAAKAVAETITKAELREAQALVDAAAKAAGYNVGPVWHQTNASFTEFRPSPRWGDVYFFLSDNRAAGKRTRTIKAMLAGRILTVSGNDFTDSQAVQQARNDGYDGVEIKHEDRSEYAVFSSSQIKSADPFTFDDDGNLIPLSERFQTDSPDIRYNPEPTEDEDPLEDEFQIEELRRAYLDIGHRGLKSKLWYGDEFNINVEPAEFDTDNKDVDPRNLHNERALRMPWHGRYDPYSGEVSITGGTRTEEWRQPSDRLLDLLRETFGADVKIVQFNPGSETNPPRRIKRPDIVIHPGCKIQVIDEATNRWKVIDTCLDTPKAIADVFRKHGLSAAWVVDALGDRRYLTRRDLEGFL